MKSPLINGKLPNGKWRWSGWTKNEWVIVIGNRAIYDNGVENENRLWGDYSKVETGWTKIESTVEVYYKKL